MKKVIFICLVSLAVCLGKPAEPQGTSPAPVTPEKPLQPLQNDKPQPQEEKTQPPQSTTNTQPQTTTQNATTDPKSNTTIPTAAVNLTTVKPEPPKDIKPTETATTAPPKNDEKKPEPTNTTTNITEKAKADKANNETKPTDKEITTTKPVTTVKPTEDPKAEDKHTVQARGFDGGSFVGGIILTLGILAVGFMGFKYYKNQTERNYHTL